MTMEKSTIDLIGYVAATCTTVSFMPQLIRVIQLRSARDISLIMFLVFSVGPAVVGLWPAVALLADRGGECSDVPAVAEYPYVEAAI
jgi:MtN3 and saliva related transmembrane protein